MTALRTWPSLPYAAWKDTCTTLHLWTQIAGKVRLARTPWVNHSWHATYYLSARGFTTSPIPNGERTFEIHFDFIDHLARVSVADGSEAVVELRPRSVADFHAALLAELAGLGISVRIHGAPNEVEVAIPFAEDEVHGAYDAAYARRFWEVLAGATECLEEFRTGFLGKCSPVHFFWGGFDLAVTRFSGRPAPPHPGGIPHLPDAVTREAYSHEVSSAGFWPGNDRFPHAAFYAYAYPTPNGFAESVVRPGAARWEEDLGEFVLPYEELRAEGRVEEDLRAFLSSTYEAAANLAEWDRAGLERPIGEVPR